MPHLIEMNLEDEPTLDVHQWADENGVLTGSVTIFSGDRNANVTFTREALLAILERLSRTTASFTVNLQEHPDD